MMDGLTSVLINHGDCHQRVGRVGVVQLRLSCERNRKLNFMVEFVAKPHLPGLATISSVQDTRSRLRPIISLSHSEATGVHHAKMNLLKIGLHYRYQYRGMCTHQWFSEGHEMPL